MELYDCINFILNRVQNSVNSHFKAKLQPFGVTPIQYSILKCLWTQDMQMPSQLAQTLQVDASTITGVIERLENKQLVVRLYSREDRRSVCVCLTEKGRTLQSSIEAVIREANLEVTRGMRPEEVAAFKKLCISIWENAKQS